MSMKRVRLFPVLAATLTVAACFAQQPPLHQPGPAASGAMPQIHFDVVVSAKTGPPVSGLQQQDFTLLDNKAAQPITSFQAVAGNQQPVEVVLVVDAVNTSYQELAYERGQISNFLKANGGHLAHPTSVVIFTDTGTQMQQGFLTDGNQLSDAFDKLEIGLRNITRSTGIYGADERLDLSLKTLSALVASEAPHPGRKLILWISPGWPILSGPGIQLDNKQRQGIFATIVDLSARLRQARVTLYAVNPLGVNEGVGRAFYYENYVKGVRNPGEVDIGDVSLQALAVQSGGLALSSTAVAQLLEESVADANAYYELTFAAAPAEKPNEYHHIEVKVDKPGLTARTRQGYYAQP